MFSLCKLNLLPRILIRVPIVPGTFSYTYAHVNEVGGWYALEYSKDGPYPSTNLFADFHGASHLTDGNGKL